MKLAQEIYADVKRNGTHYYSPREFEVICDQIREASGDRAWTIFLAKNEGWWTGDNLSTSRDIIEAPGDRALTIFFAIKEFWWMFDVKTSCDLICIAPGSRAMVIYWAKRDGWWYYTKEQAHSAILNSHVNDHESKSYADRLLELQDSPRKELPVFYYGCERCGCILVRPRKDNFKCSTCVNLLRLINKDKLHYIIRCEDIYE